MHCIADLDEGAEGHHRNNGAFEDVTDLVRRCKALPALFRGIRIRPGTPERVVSRKLG
jgi:hypothetical protein